MRRSSLCCVCRVLVSECLAVVFRYSLCTSVATCANRAFSSGVPVIAFKLLSSFLLSFMLLSRLPATLVVFLFVRHELIGRRRVNVGKWFLARFDNFWAILCALIYALSARAVEMISPVLPMSYRRTSKRHYLSIRGSVNPACSF